MSGNRASSIRCSRRPNSPRRPIFSCTIGATAFGDEKDRVVVRANGQKTYFASDIAYHLDKRERGFDLLVTILGADHHGYVARVRAGLVAMGEPGDSLEVRLVQFVTLYRGGEKVQMSTRSGEFITLRELRRRAEAGLARRLAQYCCRRPGDVDGVGPIALPGLPAGW